MLSAHEKKELYQIIVFLIGDDPAVKSYQQGFIRKTVDVVEEMINASMNCNQNLKDLFSDLASGGGMVARGWLKRSLDVASSLIKRTELRGYGCQAVIKSAWKTRILRSAV